VIDVAPLADVFEFVRNGKSVKQDASTGGLPIARIETIADGTVDCSRVGYAGLQKKGNEKWLLQRGDILFSHINSVEHIGKCAIFEGHPENLIHGMNLLALRPKKQVLDARYAFRAISSPNFRASLQQFVNKAVNQASISTTNLKSLEIPLPPLGEQRRIAVILDKADALRHMRKRALDLFDSLGQSIFLDMFDGSAQKLSISELLSRGWLVLHKDGNHGSNYPRADEFGEDGVPFLSAKSIDNEGFIDLEQIQYLGTSKAEKLKIGWIEAGDVLLAHNASVGKVALYEEQFDKALIGTSLTCYRPNPKRLLSRYLMSALRSQFFQSQLTKSMGQTTRNQVPITAQRDLKIPIPSIEQQRKYSDVVAAQMKRAAVFRHGAMSLEMLFSSLQSRAFSSQL
jgi:type I restriction enzyme, S subunit